MRGVRWAIATQELTALDRLSRQGRGTHITMGLSEALTCTVQHLERRVGGGNLETHGVARAMREAVSLVARDLPPSRSP